MSGIASGLNDRNQNFLNVFLSSVCFFVQVYLLNPIENLRGYINNRPPLVIFMISVSAVAIAFLTIGYFFKIKEIKSPELTEDWNTFLLRFNDLDLCVSENETIKHGLNESTTAESMVVTSGQARSSTQPPLLLEDSGPINISVSITLTLDPQRPFGGYSRNITHLYATVLGQQVGLSGRLFFCGTVLTSVLRNACV
ncbi:hypothetical protein CHARACLAT_027833 [Characodon lateralis]|uniref:Transmembrane protein 248 n=1 Tax=Characodon lateralis TaxID=208331 RepID=A0ABU7DM60_9TELE|nr:hypothetical protein [Characodon lateralis]